MNIQNKFKIIGTGMAVPSNRISTSEIEKRHSIPEGWGERNSGVSWRYHVTSESNTALATRALKIALKNAGIEPADLDLIIGAACSFDYIIPNRSSLIKAELIPNGGHRIECMDINTTCLSFVTALDMASGLLDGKRYKRIAIVSSEIASKGLNPANWETITLFGDAAAAAIIQHNPGEESGLIKAASLTVQEGVTDTIIKGGGSVFHPSSHPYDPELYSFSMNGKKLLHLAGKHLNQFIDDFFEQLPFSIHEIDVIIPHQASRLGLKLFKKMYRFEDGQLMHTLKDYGNCIAASIPLTLHLAVKKGALTPGKTCFLLGTSAGFSIGGVLFKM